MLRSGWDWDYRSRHESVKLEEPTGSMNEHKPERPYIDRRRRPRFPLRWTVLISRDAKTPAFQTTTINVSSEGFYCYSPESFEPGAIVHGRILIPAQGPDMSEDALCLVCRVKVVRIVASAPYGFGMGCHIETYRIVRVPSQIVEVRNWDPPQIDPAEI